MSALNLNLIINNLHAPTSFQSEDDLSVCIREYILGVLILPTIKMYYLL